MVRKKIFVFMLALFCSFACLTFAACKKEDSEGVSQTYSVNFYDYDGTRLGIPTSETDSTVIYTQKIKQGESAIAPAVPGRDGYEFKWWSKDYTNVTSDLEIYAEYALICEVVFKDYDNSILKTELVSQGGDATPPEVPDRVGYRFTGWDKDYRKVLSDTTIMAEYVEQFTVTFINYDDTVISSQLVDEGGNAAAPQERDVKQKPESDDGVYVFAGWDKTFENVQTDITVKAVFKIKTYAVSFVDWNGDLLGEVQTIKHGEAAVAPDMTGKRYLDTKSSVKAGYQFSGWDKAFDSVKKDMTITAVYDEIEDPIIFVEKKSFEQGTTSAKVGVYLITPKTVSGLKVKIYFDNENLTLKNIQPKSKFSDGYIQTKTKDNYVEFVWTCSSDISFANNFAEIFELEFEMNAYQSAGTYQIELDEEETQYTYTQDNFPQGQNVILVSGGITLTEKEGE